MSDTHPLWFLTIPPEILVALDYRPFHFALQPVHHLVRLVHILSISAFFGAIGLLDLRLMGFRSALPLRAFSEHALPWLYATFGIAVFSGILLFLYDPVHVGSHAYFSIKLLLILLGVVNAVMFHRAGFLEAMAAAGTLPRRAHVAGAVSLALWLGVMICACLNVEAAPKLLLLR